jgi:hypothetical protein
MIPVDKEISEFEKEFIREAYLYLENPSFLMKLTESLKSPIDKGIAALPEKAQKIVTSATERALKAALRTALMSLKSDSADQSIMAIEFKDSLAEQKTTRLIHGAATLITGAAGGMFGFSALPIELPLTTTLMLRSIAKTAANFGADINDRETQLECLFVLSAGSNYYSTRISFALVAKEALNYIASRSATNLAEIILQGSSPVLMRLLSMVAARFQIVVTEKLLAQAIPVTGAVAGGVINFAFTEHFNHLAKYHFGIKQLEKKYGEDFIQKIYDSNSAQRA